MIANFGGDSFVEFHPNFPSSPRGIPPPDRRWFPADEELRSIAYEKVVRLFVAAIRDEVKSWRNTGYVGMLCIIEAPQSALPFANIEKCWTGGSVFENEWQSFRTRQSRNLQLTTDQNTYDRRGRDSIAVKVIGIFGNDTMTFVPANVGQRLLHDEGPSVGALPQKTLLTHSSAKAVWSTGIVPIGRISRIVKSSCTEWHFREARLLLGAATHRIGRPYSLGGSECRSMQPN